MPSKNTVPLPKVKRQLAPPARYSCAIRLGQAPGLSHPQAKKLKIRTKNLALHHFTSIYLSLEIQNAISIQVNPTPVA
jgi:hypothetical protein